MCGRHARITIKLQHRLDDAASESLAYSNQIGHTSCRFISPTRCISHRHDLGVFKVLREADKLTLFGCSRKLWFFVSICYLKLLLKYIGLPILFSFLFLISLFLFFSFFLSFLLYLIFFKKKKKNNLCWTLVSQSWWYGLCKFWS